jgi:hypothetical protein
MGEGWGFALCPFCGQAIPLTVAGVMAGHPWNGSPACPGSGSYGRRSWA